MSLAFEVDDVAQVLLTDGKWYRVQKHSLELDTGATVRWIGPEGSFVHCRIRAIVAVKCHRHTGGVRDPQCSATGDGNGGKNANDSS